MPPIPTSEGHAEFASTSGAALARTLSGPKPRRAVAELRPHRILGHALTSPSRRTVKRLDALRREYRDVADTVAMDVLRREVLDLVNTDRDLTTALLPSARQEIADALCEAKNVNATSATVIGAFLRGVGALERPPPSAPRAKQALRELNEVLFGTDQTTTIAQGVREFTLLKHDGGMQVVATLRRGAEQAICVEAILAVLRRADLLDVIIRVEMPAPLKGQR